MYRPAINDVEVNGVALLDSGHSSTMIGLNKNRTEKGHPVLMQDWARAEQTAEMRRIAYFDTLLRASTPAVDRHKILLQIHSTNQDNRDAKGGVVFSSRPETYAFASCG